MARVRPSAMAAVASSERPYWSTVLRALREARGSTLAGWATLVGYGRATVKRWEAGQAVPTAAAEAALIEVCRTHGLCRRYQQGCLRGQTVTPEFLRDLLADARLATTPPAAAPTALVERQAFPDPSVVVGAAGVPVAGSLPHDASLPLPLTHCIGREHELADLAALLAARRLLTLTGPGGGGKTRLALQLAMVTASRFGDGAVFVGLAGATTPHMVEIAVAQVLGVREVAGQPLSDVLRAALRPKTLLLVLDNFEQVPAAAPLVVRWLSTAPDLRVVVTSRTALRVSGEKEYPVAPLGLPAALAAAADVAASPAVQLFVERVQDVRPTFALGPHNAAVVAAICRRLDGLPLAIELAAARCKVLAPDALLDRLDHRLPLLTGGAQDLPPRQRTLRATLAWSYDLLPAAEQALFRRLGVFAGGCTPALAAAVCDPEAGLGLDLLDGLSSLVDNNLLQVDGPDGEPRFVMLDTIREYALEELARHEEAPDLLRRHAEVFLALAEAAHHALAGPTRRACHDRLELEYDNLRASLAYSAAAYDAELELRTANTLFWFWVLRGRWSEGRARLEGALGRYAGQAIEAESCGAASAVMRLLATTRWCVGALAWYQGDLAAARLRLEQGLAAAQALADQHGIAYASEFLGLTALYQGDYTDARRRLQMSVECFRAAGNRWALADALFNLGDAMLPADRVAAEQLYQESLGLFRSIGDTWAALPLTSLGHLALQQGDHAAARAYLAEGLALRLNDPDRWLLAVSYASLGEVARYEGNIEEAESHFRAGLRLSREVGSKPSVAWALCGLGHLALSCQAIERAAALLGESLGLARALNQHQRLASCLVGLAAVALTREQPESAIRLLSTAHALCEAIAVPMEPADLRDARTYANAARDVLGVNVFTAVWEAAQHNATESGLNEAAALAARGRQ